jgi:exonuclease III
MHININGLPNKSNKLETVISDISNCKFLCVTEHHLFSSDYQSFKLNDFKICSIFCRDSSWGGSMILARDFDITRRNDIENLSQIGHIECSAIDTKINNELTCIVCIYRPPSGNISTFMDVVRIFFAM